jgi:hypothetical protein
MTLVAPSERFNALAILVTPFFSLAIVFNMRTSSFDHARRITFFFLANFDSLFLGTGLVTRQSHLAIQRPINFTKDFLCSATTHFGAAERELPTEPKRHASDDSFQHILMIENSQQQRHTGAAVESLRNEVLKLNGYVAPTGLPHAGSDGYCELAKDRPTKFCFAVQLWRTARRL